MLIERKPKNPKERNKKMRLFKKQYYIGEYYTENGKDRITIYYGNTYIKTVTIDQNLVETLEELNIKPPATFKVSVFQKKTKTPKTLFNKNLIGGKE